MRGVVWFVVFWTPRGNPAEILVARIGVPVGTLLLLFALVNQMCNHASVVFDHEGISRATWMGKYGVKTIRWQDIVHVNIQRYRRSGGTTVIRLYGAGTTIALSPDVYTDRVAFRAALARHLQDIAESQRSTT